MRESIHAKTVAVVILLLGLWATGWAAGTSKFDSGNQGGSALGQLEDIAGQKVDQSSPGVSTIDTYKKNITLPQKPAPKPKPAITQQQAVETMVTGMVMGALLQAALSDNSQQDADDAAARALAEAEQKRIQEEQRKQRIQSASNLRNFWDQRDRDMSDSLEDVFSCPGQGTNFFSENTHGGKPVDLNDTRNPVMPVGDGAPGVPQVSAPVPEMVTAESTPFQESLVKKGADYVQEKAVESAKDKLKEAALGLLPGKTAANLEMMLDYKDRFKEWSDNLFKAIEPNRLVHAAAGDQTAYAAVTEDLDRVQHQALHLPFGSPLSEEEENVGFKLLNKQPVTFEEAKQVGLDRMKGFFSEKLQDHILSGES